MTEAAPSTVRLSEPSESTLYDLVERVGEGGMGTVYRARDRATNQVVAVKLLKKDADAVRFAREVSALARLDHPNIVRYAGHGLTEDGTPFVAMEWLEGESLEEALVGGRLPLRRALEVARDVAAALDHAHAEGIVHRDLKPSNVFLTKDGATKVLDFGVARFLDESGLTHSGQVIGTPSYMAPEQARGARSVGPSADLFSLGCILYRCIADEGPFAAPDVMGVLTKLATHTPPPLRSVPRAVGELVSGLLAKDPSARPSSAREVERALDALLATDLRPDATPAVAERTLASHHAPKRARAPWVAAAVVLALAAGAASWLASTKRPAPHPAPPAIRAVAQRACRTWATEMARRQKSDGSFTGESHRDPTGWDTGQELAALERAQSCATIAPVTLRTAADALSKMRRPDGWAGPERVPNGPASVPADAWAVIAFSLASRDDAAQRAPALSARALLLSTQRPDGSFSVPGPTSAGNDYATMIAAWALATSASLDGDAASRAAARSARAWLRREFQPSAELRSVAGLEEQLLWVLATLRRDAPDDHDDDDMIRAGAADLVARCGLDRATRACTRPMYDEGAASLGTGELVTLWHAWVGAASDAILASGVSLAPDLHADLAAITAWDVGTIESSIDALAALPEYELAEYLVAMSSLASPR